MVGKPVATSDWFPINQARITRFADATGDHQAIHIDPAAGEEAGFGGTIAHGFLILSMFSAMADNLPTIAGQSTKMNYGFDRVRFVAPVKEGARVQAEFRLKAATWRDNKRLLMELGVTVVSDVPSKQVVIADWLGMIFFHEPQEVS